MVAGLGIVAGNNAKCETRLKIYNTITVPMLKYGREVWTLKKTDKDAVHQENSWTLLDRKRNADAMNELRTIPILSKIRNYRRGWRAHVDRMNKEQYSPVHADRKQIEGKTEKEVGGYLGFIII